MNRVDFFAKTVFREPVGKVADKFRDLETRRDQKRIEQTRQSLLSRHSIKQDGKQVSKGLVTSIAETIGRGRSIGNVIVCGKHVEVYVSPESQHVGAATSGAKMPNGEHPESDKSIARRVNSRARKQIRRIVNTNELQGMITLTIAPPSPDNDRSYATVPIVKQRDYEYVRGLWHTYKSRLRKQSEGVNVDYVVVFELHDSERTSPEKRGTWHIHIAVKADAVLAQAMRDCWLHGRTDYQDFRFDKAGNRRKADIQNPGAYIADYIGKDGAQFGAKELQDKKRYTTSRGLLKPLKKSIEEVDIVEDDKNNILHIDGKAYKETYLSIYRIPGTDRMAVNAHYVEVER